MRPAAAMVERPSNIRHGGANAPSFGAAFSNWGVPVVAVLSSVYIGYSPTFVGSIAGAVWAFANGFIGGVIMGWLYNKIVSRRA